MSSVVLEFKNHFLNLSIRISPFLSSFETLFNTNPTKLKCQTLQSCYHTEFMFVTHACLPKIDRRFLLKHQKPRKSLNLSTFADIKFSSDPRPFPKKKIEQFPCHNDGRPRSIRKQNCTGQLSLRSLPNLFHL